MKRSSSAVNVNPKYAPHEVGPIPRPGALSLKSMFVFLLIFGLLKNLSFLAEARKRRQEIFDEAFGKPFPLVPLKKSGLLFEMKINFF